MVLDFCMEKGGFCGLVGVVGVEEVGLWGEVGSAVGWALVVGISEEIYVVFVGFG